ncbi:MAG TPA: hypothetical protein VGK59_02040 [Ohtaekwangia sp.]
MPCLKKFCILSLFAVLSCTALAQTVKVKKETARVKGENIEGYEVVLEGSYESVAESFTKFLKTIGKVKQGDDGILVNEPSVNGLAYKQPLLAATKQKDKAGAAWIGIKSSDWAKEDAEKVNKELEKILKDFGVKFYRDQIQLQVDESTRASLAVDKQKQRLTNENKTLNTKLEDNKREKLQLEKSLEANKLENETLLKKLEKNKHDQDSVALAGEQIKKVVDMHKDRQRKVN